MKVAIVTDSHIGMRNDNSILNEYFLDFFKNQFLPYLVEHNIKKVIHLGDIFDRRKYINFNTLNSWWKVFDKLHDIVDSADFLIGNHCTYYKNSNNINSPEQLLSKYNKFTVYSKPETINIDNIPVCYIPWVCSENLEDTLKVITETDAKICMGHLELIGFQMLSGITCDHSLISKNLLVKFSKVFSGHFHWRSSSKNIHYLGCPYQLNWGDYGNKKGFHIFDIHSQKLNFVENPKEIFIKIEYDDCNAELNFLSSIDFSQYKNKFIKLLVKRKTNPYLFSQFLEMLYAHNVVELQITDIQMESTSKEIIADVKDIRTIIKNNIVGREIEETLKPKLIKYIDSLYNKTLY